MNMFGGSFMMMNMGNSRVPSMRKFFDVNVVPQFWAPPAQIGSVPSSVESGMIDPNSIVPGLGFGANNVPAPPTMEDTMALMGMYQNQQANEGQYFNHMYNDVLAKKEEVFKENHYKFDEDGSPVLNEETGKPEVFEGSEDAFGKFQRHQWEQGVAQEMGEKHQEEFMNFERTANKILLSQDNKPSSMFDIQARQNRNEQIESLQKQEHQLLVSQKQEYLQEIAGHLPNPDSEGETIGQYIDQGFQDYSLMTEQSETDITTSDAGQVFQDYFDAVGDFLAQQQQIWDAYGMESFDPNAMKNFAKGQKLV
ncbi:MAG: hypothetical protein K8T10_06455 [Candidatus Eremiobacteraeota bacterium]|nr:hypothetical protein [Candidatus Eremiobacteraeota bacterium]